MKVLTVGRAISDFKAASNCSDMHDNPELRVVLLTNGFTPNRIPLWNALNRLCDLTVVLLASTEKRRQWTLELEQVEAHVRITGAKQLFFPSFDWALSLAFRSISESLDEINPQAIILGGYDSPGYWAASRWARKRHVPTVLWMGSTLMSSRLIGNPVLDFIKHYFFARCDAYYAYGHCAGKYLQHYGAPADRIVEGVNQTNVDHFDSCERTAEYQNCALLYIGQLIPQKGVIEFFDALARVTDLRWTLTVTGSGELRSALMVTAEQNGFADRIVWRGYVQQKDLSPTYRSADVLLMPSLNEVWGLVINEALMSGVYVIGSDQAAASLELIQPGVNGEIVDPEPVSIERALRSAIARAPFKRSEIRATISQVTPQNEAAKIMQAITLASS